MKSDTAVRVAAIQLSVKIGDTAANIKNCSRLAMERVSQGAKWIALPEFFNTGMAWDPTLVCAFEDENGPSASFLKSFSKTHHVFIGGSFLCRLQNGSIRNRYMGYVNGKLLGIHDKDLPSFWENAFYEGGDDGDRGLLGNENGMRVGAAVCWEFMRTQTARRLRGQVDLIMGGSCWWSTPDNWPKWLTKHDEKKNIENMIGCIRDTARLVGAPIVHASHCGHVVCPNLGLPFIYHGRFEGNAIIVDAEGNILASRRREEGEGVIVADLLPTSIKSEDEIPDGFWLRSPGGILPWFAWYYQGWLGRKWYRRFVKPRSVETK